MFLNFIDGEDGGWDIYKFSFSDSVFVGCNWVIRGRVLEEFLSLLDKF